MNRKTLNRRSIVTVVAVVLALLMPASLTLVYASNDNPGVLPPQSAAYGKTYAQWAAAWWQWALSIPYSSNPVFDATGANCGIGQSGPVWFLAGTSGGPATRTCTIPAGKALFFPIINVENDYPCPPDFHFEPSPGQSLADFLTNGNDVFWGARQYMDHVTALNVEVDGVPLQNLFGYRATSAMYTFTGDPSLTATYDPCITGAPQQAVADGYWVMLAPLSAGTHIVHFHGVGPWDVEATYKLTMKQ